MQLLAHALAEATEGTPCALATVIAASGSTPRHAGAKMLVGPDGIVAGTIGGGRIELEVCAAAAEVVAGGPARRVEHHLVRDLAMCCGGSMQLWVEPVAPSLAAIAQAVARWRARRPGLLVTPLDGSGKQVVELDAHVDRAAAIEVAAPGVAPSSGAAPRFVEPIRPADRVLLFGCGHVARAIGPLAASCGFEVVICDDGETGAIDAAPPWAARVVDSFEPADVERAVGPLGVGDYALIVTRDHAVDQRILERLLPRTALTYLGMIGSLGKVGRFRKRLAVKGALDEAQWARLRAPIGLDLGAETPEEIAVAIVGELVARRRRGPGTAAR